MTPNEPTDGPVVLFDGECGLCRNSVRRIARADRAGRFRFAPSRSDAGRKLLTAHGLPESPGSMVLIDAGRAYTHTDALIRLAKRLGFPYSLAAAAQILPRKLRDAAYGVLARNRYRIAGRTDVCEPVPDDVRDRVLR